MRWLASLMAAALAAGPPLAQAQAQEPQQRQAQGPQQPQAQEAQQLQQGPTALVCPSAAQVSRQHLLGLWRAQFDGLAPGATLLLEQHPELAGSVRGTINRNGQRAALAGDIGDAEFSLEESVNGVNISAVWLGEVVEGSCGREIRGDWKAEGQPHWLPFVLRKQGAR